MYHITVLFPQTADRVKHAQILPNGTPWSITSPANHIPCPSPQAAREQSLIPKGMRIMPEDERLEMLATLKASLDEVQSQMQQLPFRLDTPSMKRLKGSLDSRMTEIEEAMRVFSRPKVLIQE